MNRLFLQNKMNRKVFIGFYLLSIIASCFGDCRVNPNDKNNFFQCIEDREDVVLIHGFEIACPKNTICNYLGKQNEENNNKCDPCIGTKSLCATRPYTCEDDGFKINDIHYKCPIHTKCNAASTTSCSPCEKIECDRSGWTCMNDMVITNGVQGKCAIGYQCNSQYIYPCEPCIGGNSSIIYPNAATNVKISSWSFLLLTPLFYYIF